MEIRRELLLGAQGASGVCHSPKSYTKIGERNSPRLERGTARKGREGQGNSFLKPLSMCSQSNPFEFSLSLGVNYSGSYFNDILLF